MNILISRSYMWHCLRELPLVAIHTLTVYEHKRREVKNRRHKMPYLSIIYPVRLCLQIKINYAINL